MCWPPKKNECVTQGKNLIWPSWLQEKENAGKSMSNPLNSPFGQLSFFESNDSQQMLLLVISQLGFILLTEIFSHHKHFFLPQQQTELSQDPL